MKIDKGIDIKSYPLRPKRKGYGATQLIVKAMQVGDSVFMAGRASNTGGVLRQAAASLNLPYAFSCRLTEENGVKGVRVWRIK